MNKAADLLKKLNDAASAARPSSKDAVSKKLTPEDIQEVNLLIKELGITTLFETTATLSPGLSTKEQINNEAVTRMLAEYHARPQGTYADKDSDTPGAYIPPASQPPEWMSAFNTEVKAACGGTVPQTLTQAQMDNISIRLGLTPPPTYPTTPQGMFLRAQTPKVSTDAGLLAKSQDALATVQAEQKKYEVVGGMLPTSTGRDISSASTRMQTELQVIGQHHQSAMTDANDDLGVQNNFLQAARSFIEELLKLSSGTIQRF